jgi:hypothetical protein
MAAGDSLLTDEILGLLGHSNPDLDRLRRLVVEGYNQELRANANPADLSAEDRTKIASWLRQALIENDRYVGLVGTPPTLRFHLFDGLESKVDWLLQAPCAVCGTAAASPISLFRVRISPQSQQAQAAPYRRAFPRSPMLWPGVAFTATRTERFACGSSTCSRQRGPADSTLTTSPRVRSTRCAASCSATTARSHILTLSKSAGQARTSISESGFDRRSSTIIPETRSVTPSRWGGVARRYATSMIFWRNKCGDAAAFSFRLMRALTAGALSLLFWTNLGKSERMASLS